jgi:two-component system phosphate regulon sensor histidine kinase PhoR
VGEVILEILTLIGMAISFVFAFLLIYYFKYFKKIALDSDEFRKSYTAFLFFLIAIFIHSIYMLGAFYRVPFRVALDIFSVTLFFVTMFFAAWRGLMLLVASKVSSELEEELEKTSKELIETKEFYTNIVQSSADAIVASDNKKKITYFSKGAEDLFQIKAEDALGTPVLKLYPKDALMKKDRLKRAKELREKEIIRNITMKIFTPQNEAKDISLSLSLLKVADGKVTGTVGVAKDITSEVKKTGQISYLKELSEKVILGVPDGLMLIDQEFNISLVNSGFERIIEVKKELITGKSALDYLKIPQMDEFFEAMELKKKFVQVAYSGETLGPGEFSLIVNEQKKMLTDYWTPLLDRDGKVEFILIIIRDMTKRKLLEEDLKEQATKLQKSNELKDIFTDVMRHDILNPIGVIKNYIDLIADEPLEPMVKQSLEAINRNANKTVEMIESASELAKIESEEQIVFEKADLATILAEAVETVEKRATEKSMSLEVKGEGDYPARVNSFMEDVFLNLLTNAIKYSPEKTKITTGIEDAGLNWRFYVKDQGEGVPDKFKIAIFTRFERLKKEGVKGSGMGLAIVKKIVEMHRGRVWVEDNPGGGSIFYVIIPKDIK